MLKMQAQNDTGHIPPRTKVEHKEKSSSIWREKRMTLSYETWNLAKPEVYPLNFTHFVSQEIWFCLS